MEIQPCEYVSLVIHDIPESVHSHDAFSAFVKVEAAHMYFMDDPQITTKYSLSLS